MAIQDTLNQSTAPTTTPQAPPSEEEVVVASGGRSWRFSKGAIVTGRSDDGSLQERKRIVGNIVRVGIHEGRTNDQYAKPYKQVECDVQTSNGLIYVKAGLLDGETFELRPSQAALTFGWGLLQFPDPNKVAMITTSQGEAWTDDKGRPREASTYVNWAIVGTDNVARPIYRPKTDPKAPKTSSVEKWQALEDQLRKHPLFADRPAGHEDEDAGATHLSELCADCVELNWPTPEQAPAEWLAMVGAALGQPVQSTLNAVSDDDWGQIRLALKGAVESGSLKGMPPTLVPAAQRLAKAAAPAPVVTEGDKKPDLAAAFGAPAAQPFSDGKKDPFKDE